MRCARFLVASLLSAFELLRLDHAARVVSDGQRDGLAGDRGRTRGDVTN